MVLAIIAVDEERKRRKPMIGHSVLALVLSAVALPARTMGPSTDDAHCRQMTATFDRLVPEYDGSAARHDRVRGELECLKGNFTDGEKLLENALRSVGCKPAAY